MIISASRRTDIPAYYSEWFFRRLSEGFVLVRNPVNPKSVSRISLSPDVVDGMVLWTKNPKPMLSRLDALKDYPYYFQFTLTPYGKDIEANLPPKGEVIDTFRKLSDRIGPDRVIWRYDPILLNEKYTAEYHIERFAEMAGRLRGYSHKCVISFVDHYRSIAGNIGKMGLFGISEGDMRRMAKHFSSAAKEAGFLIDTCAEAVDLSEYGIGHAKCVDGAVFTAMTGIRYTMEKDKNQRRECGCAASVDIGAYNTCPGGCMYCYASHSAKLIGQNTAKYDANEPLLCGRLGETDVIRDREAVSNKKAQMEFDLK